MLTAASLVTHSMPGLDPGGVPISPASASSVVPGVTFERIHKKGPQEIRVLTIKPSVAGAIDVVTAKNSLPGFQRTSNMASAVGAIAAVNGDFGLPPGRPAHLFAADASLKQTSALGINGKTFSVTQDETESFIGISRTDIDVDDATTGAKFAIDNWNDGSPSTSQVSAWTSFGGTLEEPTNGLCTARLLPADGPKWGPGKVGIARAYVVDAVQCGGAPLPLGGGVVIGAQTGGSRAADVSDLGVGDEITLSWSLRLPGVTEAIGGSPILLADGAIMVSADCNTYLCSANPRTAVGIKANGDILLVVIDGRQPGWSKGMTQIQEARYLKSLGAVDALNLDGGGSSTMVVRDVVKNRPSDGNERAVSSAIVILPGADPDEPFLGVGAAPFALSAAQGSLGQPDQKQASPVADVMLTDPGSTGGLLASLAGEGRSLSGAQEGWLQTFRESQRREGSN